MSVGGARQSMPERGIPPSEAFRHVRAQISDAYDPTLDLAQHHTLWMDQQADQLIAENLHRGVGDGAIHPQLHVIQQRVVGMLCDLFNAPAASPVTGTATNGAVEAALLAGLAHKWRWRAMRAAAGAETARPNIIIAADRPPAWLRFAHYFDIEARPATLQAGAFISTPSVVAGLIDQNTIAVTATLATAFSGDPDHIEELSELLGELEQTEGWDIPLHVDASAGAFILPFTEPDFVWDFRLPRVKTISVCSHKYGGVYPGLGWLIFREEDDLPAELRIDMRVNGHVEEAFALTSSHGSALALGQYYNLIRHGRSGYQEIAEHALGNARYLADQLGALEQLRAVEQLQIIGAGRRVPIVALCAPISGERSSLHELGELLRQRGWVVQASVLPIEEEPATVLRFVIPEHFSTDMADLLVRDVQEDLETIQRQ